MLSDMPRVTLASRWMVRTSPTEINTRRPDDLGTVCTRRDYLLGNARRPASSCAYGGRWRVFKGRTFSRTDADVWARTRGVRIVETLPTLVAPFIRALAELAP
jgi:hypothetical protein